MPTSLRVPPPRPSMVRLTTEDKIAFLHPGYSAPRNQLFSLPRVDAVDGDAGRKYGVHHLTALTACQIVANNAFGQGRLCTDAKGLHPAAEPMDGVLTAPQYYFVLDDDDHYPVVPSFQDWEFPHDKFPAAWWPAPSATQHEGTHTPSSPPVTTRHCVVTNSGLASTLAHLVPKEHEPWFALNAMSRYGTGVRGIDDDSNSVPMRADIHKCFDDRMFAIVPKPDGDNNGLRYAVHTVDEGGTEFRDLHHNTAIQNIAGMSREYAFARFAWCMLMRVKSFLTQRVPRHLVRFGLFDGPEPEAKTEDMKWEDIDSLYGGGKSRSSSPRKRKLGRDEDEDGANEWYERNVEEPHRGRTRKRVCHSVDGEHRHETDVGPSAPIAQGQEELV
ncbi:hypothetical protein B0T16DRAFT_426038 [Cercophora newfieldiana]|uniref:HNH nuclease domain-containing protein n=1 Tax=Cercophora newfieldiana TaxID=92897 RepID=A0AA40D0B5_9PEZI|nr:hypothetical protein B0T16DRAFT_426038 [Cercophora newfieldiana]